MKAFIILTTLLVAVSAIQPRIPVSKNPTGGRIIDGTEATSGQFPWQASVRGSDQFGGWFCGGSLISSRWVLTAAHCVDGAQSFEIRLGGLQNNNGDLYTTSDYIIHEDYNANTITNDIALINLNTFVEFTETVSSIYLPSATDYIPAGVSLRVSGWGKTSDSSSIATNLQWVDLTSISNAECSGVYGSLAESVLCVRGDGSKSTCSGDSGGPLTQIDDNGTRTQVGVVSFGAAISCEFGFPNGFSRTASFREWIAVNSGV